MTACRYLAGLAADAARNVATSDARAGFLTRTCPCADCAEWRASRKRVHTVRMPAPYIPQGFLAPRWSPERAEGARLYNRVTLDAMEPCGVVYVSPAVEVLP